MRSQLMYIYSYKGNFECFFNAQWLFYINLAFANTKFLL